MYTPRPPFNGLFATVLLGFATFCGNAHAQAPAAPATPAAPTTPAPTESATERPIGLSAVFERYYQDLFSELKTDNPADLVPPLALARDRLLDKSAKVNTEKKAVYDLGIKLLDNMRAVAEERTQYLVALLKTAARPSASLESAKSTSTSNQHFLTLQIQKSNDALKRKKPALDAMFAQLKTAERTWNARFPDGMRAESYNFKGLWYPMIEGLDQKASNQNPANYPWRSAYYQRYGAPKPK